MQKVEVCVGEYFTKKNTVINEQTAQISIYLMTVFGISEISTMDGGGRREERGERRHSPRSFHSLDVLYFRAFTV